MLDAILVVLALVGLACLLWYVQRLPVTDAPKSDPEPETGDDLKPEVAQRRGRPSISVSGGGVIRNVHIADGDGEFVVSNASAGRSVVAGGVSVTANSKGATILLEEGSSFEGVLNGHKVRVVAPKGEGHKEAFVSNDGDVTVREVRVKVKPKPRDPKPMKVSPRNPRKKST